MVHRFGEYELDVAAGELRRRGRAVEIQPKPLALLVLLVREHGRVVSAREIRDELWPGTTVTPASLSRAVSHARRAIGDTNRGALIRSVSRRGYRFCGELVDAEAARALPEVQPERDRASVFVGREDELARLGRAWAETAAGRGGVALVTGAAGIGKTRLLERFASDAAARGARVLTGRSRAGDGVPPFWLWTQVLRQLRDEDTGDQTAELGELLPELASDSDRSRFRVLDATSRALVRASRARPLLVLLEDLQWADPPSLRLLEHLSFELGGEPILVVASVRNEFRERGHPLDRTLGVLRQQERTAELALVAFSRREVAALLGRVLGRPAPTDLSSEVFARTEGVPLFLREAIRLLAERGVLDEPERLPRAGIALPGRALDLIGRALDTLSEPARALVAAAAVLGRDFALDAAAEVADVSLEAALDSLDDAARAGVAEASPDDTGAWRFTHALFREAAYAAISAGERVRLHLRAARWLEHVHATSPEAAMAELAHHHHRALALGDPARALEWALRAAEQAARLGAWEQAAQHYEQAVAAVGHARPVDPERRLSVLLALGEACRLSGERTRRREVLVQALDLARSLGLVDELARAAIAFSDLQDWGIRDAQARGAVTEALAALGDAPSVARARLLTRLAYFDVLHDAYVESRPIARQAVALAREAGDPEALQDALYVLHFAIGGPDHVDERARLGDETVRVGAASPAADRALISLVDLASDRMMLGDRAAANALRARADAIGGEHPTPAMRWHKGVYDTGLALLEGRFEHVRPLSEQALLVGRRAEHPYARSVHGGQRALLAQERGDFAGVLSVWEPVLGAVEGPLHWLAAKVARARLAVGRVEEARAQFESLAKDDFADVPRNLRWTATLVELAFLCAELDDVARAKPLHDLLAPFEHQHAVMPIVVFYGGPARFALARLCETLGRRDDALALCDEARTSAVELGARPTQARVALRLGLLSAPRDRRRAKAALAESAKLAGELGMAAVAAEARAALEALA
ncbi:MAG TPA: AAA family ATPase [Myxococcota bacterium]|nr:AAA family ATPase [Myxococcota bacterium]